MAHQGVLLVAVGMRYKGYCANLGRTFMVDPTKVHTAFFSYRVVLTYHSQEQEAVYNVLLDLQSELLDALTDGAIARDVYQRAVDFVREKKPELEKHLPKTLGFGVSFFPFTVAVG
jgi:nucleosome binding factor SPN SPT16 subunit